MSIPDHPFWDFSVRHYRQPGVADACLFVQDRYGLNVNLVLFCIWAADTGRGALTAADMTAALRRVEDWEAQVIEPLREIRRISRHEALGVPEFLLQAFQPHIRQVELEAEQIEQRLLEELVPGPGSATGEAGGAPARDAVSSLTAYLGALDVVPDAQLSECLSVILQAAFAGVHFPTSGVSGR